MIRHQRSGRAKAGKAWEIVKFAKEVADFVNTKYAPVSVQVYSELFGDLDTVYWQTDYDDLASLEEIQAKLTSDPDYLAILSKGSDIFIEGTLHDKLMKSV
jgi:hypothetical protein